MAINTQAVWDALQTDDLFKRAIPESLWSLYRGYIDRVEVAISPHVLQARVDFSMINAASAEFLYYIMSEWVTELSSAKGYDAENAYYAFLDALKEFREFALDPSVFLDYKETTEGEYMATVMGFRPEVLSRIQSPEGLTIAELLELQPALVLVCEY